MIKHGFRILLVGFLIGQLISSGCASMATIKRPGYEPFLRSKPIEDEALNKIRKESPKDAVFADLLQAFALMRSSDITNPAIRKNILGLLEVSVNSFEDMVGPDNFSLAFSVDEDKPFRGRPYERMFAATMAGVFLMADNNCGQALPYLKNAEFLDARFQKMPFGTDAPLIYALRYRCLLERHAAKGDIAHAASGVFRSVRFLTMQETLVSALIEIAETDLRPMAVANRLANMIYEISIYHSLMTAPSDFGVDALVDDAAKNASIFISALNTHFEDEYKARMKPMIAELARVYNMNSKDGIKHLEELSLERVGLEARVIGDKLRVVLAKHARYRANIHSATEKTKELTEKILTAAAADKMMLSFVGRGPALVREGSYKEISVIKPGPDGSTAPNIRKRSLKIDTSCGFHRTDSDGGFSVVLCKPGTASVSHIEVMPSLELMSLSRKATTAQGRKFDKVLKGRAQFRAATEKIAEVSAWSAFFLFHMGAAMMSDCQRRGESQACYTKGYVLWGIAALTAIFSGTVWLIGKSKNPSADSRYIHLMYESVFVSI